MWSKVDRFICGKNDYVEEDKNAIEEDACSISFDGYGFECFSVHRRRTHTYRLCFSSIHAIWCRGIS